MRTFEDVVSQSVVLPTGVILVGLLLLALLGIALIASAYHEARKWRRLEREHGARDVTEILKRRPVPESRDEHRRAA